MIRRKGFIIVINQIYAQRKREEQLGHALQAYTRDKNFTGWHTDFETQAVKFLAGEFDYPNAKDLIEWWLESDKPSDNSRFFSYPDTGEVRSLKNAGELYDYLAELSPVTSHDIQVEAVKFALATITELRATNEKTHNQDWEERDALLTLAQEKITNGFRQKTNDFTTDLDSPNYVLFCKGES